jgi:HEAT repeat protein
VSDAAAAPALAELLASSAPVIVRANAARALGAAGTAEQAPDLAKLVGDSGQPLRVRQEAALALGKIGDPAVVATLAAALDQAAGDPAQDAVQLRISIVQALGGIGTGPAREALQRHQKRELTEVERVFTQRALGTP